MENVLTLVSIICSAITDIWIFAKGTNIPIRRNYKYLIVAIYLIATIFFSGLTPGMIVIFNLGELLLFFFLFHKKNIKLVLGIAIAIPICDLLVDVISSMIVSIILGKYQEIYVSLVRVALILVTILLWDKYAYVIYEQLLRKQNNIFLWLLGYVYISLNIITLIFIYNTKKIPVWSFFSIVLLVQTLFAIWIYITMMRVQSEILTKQQQQEIRQKQRQLEEYADYLEKSEDDLRAFRHDYKNILNSLKVSAQEGNVQEVIQKLDKYTETNLNSEALLKYKDVNHIYIKSIKSIIVSKLTEMYNLNIPYNFECRSGIHKLPGGVDELDLVRIMGITFDNAIEESKTLAVENHEIRSANVQIMVYSEGSNEFEYEIRNRIQNKKISTTQIQQRGFTTKKDHKGLGLANIKEIENKYPDMSISYTVQDGWFDFYMVIDTEDGEEDG